MMMLLEGLFLCMEFKNDKIVNDIGFEFQFPIFRQL